MDLTSKEYLEKLMEMNMPENQAVQVAVYNCYCRRCKKACLYQCKTEKHMAYINKDSVTCADYEEWGAGELGNYVENMMREQKKKESSTTSQ